MVLKVPTAVNVPPCTVNCPVTVRPSTPIVTPVEELLEARSLKVVAAEPPIVWPEADPLKVTVLLPAVKADVPLLLVQFPATFIAVAVPASNVPACNVSVPLRVSVVVLPPTLRV